MWIDTIYLQVVNSNKREKMSKSKLVAIAIGLGIAFLVVLSCEGPEGPAGRDGNANVHCKSSK